MTITGRMVSLLSLLVVGLHAGAAESASLEGTYWRLLALDGAALELAPASRPHIALHREDRRLAGFGGCNRFFARYDYSERNISFQLMGGGRVSCPETGDLEQRFLAMLSRVDRFAIDEDRLRLLNDGTTVGVFQAVETP